MSDIGGEHRKICPACGKPVRSGDNWESRGGQRYHRAHAPPRDATVRLTVEVLAGTYSRLAALARENRSTVEELAGFLLDTKIANERKTTP